MNDSIAALRETAQRLRNSTAIQLKYVKGKWTAGSSGAEMNGAELVSRPDWCMQGWTRFWLNKRTAFIAGYVTDRFVPPPRQLLGDHDEDEWAIYCKGRDPWSLQFHLPFFDLVSGQQFVWSTNTRGGEDAVGAILNAYVDHLTHAPTDEATLPRILLNFGGYNHPTEGFFVATPQLDIVGWKKPPDIPRPVLPAPPKLPLSLSSSSEPKALAASPEPKALAASPAEDPEDLPF
jgi:hypothetical protein